MRQAIHYPNPTVVILACALGLGLSTACTISALGGLAVACIFTFTVTALTRPVLLGYLVILGTALGSGMARGRAIPHLAPNEAILLYASAAALPFILRKPAVRGDPAGVFAAGTLALIAGTVILPCSAYPLRGVRLTPTEVSSLLAPLQYPLLFWLFRSLPAGDEERFRCVRWMWGCAAIVAAVGLLQAAGWEPAARFLQDFYPSRHTSAAAEVQRVTSLMGAWNGLGTFLTANLLLIRAFQPHLKGRRERLGAWAAALVCAACLLASGSYAGLGGLLCGYLILQRLQPGGVREAGPVLAAAAAGLILLRAPLLHRLSYQFAGGELIPATLRFRLEVWREVFWPAIQRDWLWGYRPGLQGLAWRWPESQYIHLVLRGGIFALAAHVSWISAALAWTYRRAAGGEGARARLAAALVALLAVLSIMGLSNEVFTFSGTIDYVWILLGLLAGSRGRGGWR